MICAARLLAIVGSAWLVAGPAAPAPFERTEERARCAQHDPLRRPFFGDLHAHTAYSFDAWAQGTRGTPDDAYRFAKGAPLAIQPFDDEDRPRRKIQLDRPLDFAMVSDHAELLGVTRVCGEPGLEGHDSFTCGFMRRFPALGYMVVNSQWGSWTRRPAAVCGDDGRSCLAAASGVWRSTRDAAEAHYDRSASCAFTTFVGYEWSGSRDGMIHRNVVFRNDQVPEQPANALDDRSDERVLWNRLDRECRGALPGCDVLAIPHNSNLSMGSQFWTETGGPDGVSLDRETARQRARLEPLVEITQHKGDSECRAGGEDERCGFETLRFGPAEGLGGLGGPPPPSAIYVREALLEGLLRAPALGTNPFAFGLIGSTDTHLAAPGYVTESAFVGHAAGPVTARLGIPRPSDHLALNPGGLAVLWAEENSRDALFAAMQRREAYGTSGPRLVVRSFGGWALDPSMCAGSDFAARGYEAGVPMGGDLRPQPSAVEAPKMAVWAMADPGSERSPGAPLERVQIVKGWIDAAGAPREQVFDLVVDERARPVNPRTCAPPSEGARSLCQVWTDPDFEAGLPAFYYARVLEHETCRWSQHECLAFGAGCDVDEPVGIQERAWTSPIFYMPPGVNAPTVRGME